MCMWQPSVGMFEGWFSLKSNSWLHVLRENKTHDIPNGLTDSDIRLAEYLIMVPYLYSIVW